MDGAFRFFGWPLDLNSKTARLALAWGSPVLGFISVDMIAIPVLFYLNGRRLRAR